MREITIFDRRTATDHQVLVAKVNDQGDLVLEGHDLGLTTEEFWGDLSCNGRRLIKELMEGTMEIWRDEYVSADWHRSDARQLPSSKSRNRTREPAMCPGNYTQDLTFPATDRLFGR